MLEDTEDISISKQMDDWGKSDIGITRQLDDFQSGAESLSRRKLGELNE